MLIITPGVRRAAPPGVWQRLARACTSPPCSPRRRPFATSAILSKAQPEALRILFCGSDAFSCASLHALHAEHRRDAALVERLEVMVQPGKRMGRGFKKTAQVPCKELAQELGLTIHERTTFRDWTLPQGTNLVVAVSFGLFVPPRILASAKYGGLNVHPSLLPHLRGPAPIHHACLRGDQHTGVSLQTLDPHAFDHGTVLAQTPAPGLPIPPDQSFADLKHALAVRGAALLVEGLRAGVHIPPHADAGWWAAAAGGPPTALAHAPKTTKADMQLDAAAWAVDDVLRRLRVFGSVWMRGVAGGGKVKRVLLTRAVAVGPDTVALQGRRTCLMRAVGAQGAETELRVRVDATSGVCYFEDGAGRWMAVERAKMEGQGEKVAVAALRTLFYDAV